MLACEEYMKHVDMTVTKDIENFVRNEVFGESEYLFVSKINGKNKGYCSKCKNEYEVENVSHNDYGICPICTSKLQVKLNRYGRKKCFNEACFYYFEKSILDSNTIICKGYYVSKDYTVDYRNPKVDYELTAIYVLEPKKATMMKKSWGYNFGWGVRNSIFDFNIGWYANKMCYCSFESIEKSIQGTSFQYIPYKRFIGTYSMVKLFQEYIKYPWIEQIIKVGLGDVIDDKLRGRFIYNCLNYKGKDIYGILRLSRKDLKDIRESEVKINPLFLRLYQLQLKDKSKLSIKEIKEIEAIALVDYAKVINILKHTTMKKVIKYINKQYEKYNEKHRVKSSVLITWSDYIDDCINLGMNLKQESVLYPKDVHTAHQNTLKQVILKKDTLANEKILKKLDDINNKYYFEYKNLIIRAAESVEELIEEGKALHHCVGTYTEKYTKGSTSILFIRQKEYMDESFYTVEVNKNNVLVQVRGKCNCSPSKEVQEFIEMFKKVKLNVNKSNVAVSA